MLSMKAFKDVRQMLIHFYFVEIQKDYDSELNPSET